MDETGKPPAETVEDFIAPANDPELPEELPKTEHELRHERYINSLENVNGLSAEDIYPSEIKTHTWVRLNEDERQEFINERNPIPLNRDEYKSAQLFMNEEGVYFLLPPFSTGDPDQATQLFLNALATTREIASWKKIDGAVLDKEGKWFEDPEGNYRMDYFSDVVKIFPNAIERVVNRIGNEQASREVRQEQAAWLVAKFVHESVHMTRDKAGGTSDIPEIAPVMAEFLTLPNINKEPERILGRGIGLLETQERGTIYERAALLGSLILAQEDGELPAIDDPEVLARTLTKWGEGVRSYKTDQLAGYRAHVAEILILDENDEGSKAAVTNLLENYPLSLAFLARENSIPQ